MLSVIPRSGWWYYRHCEICRVRFWSLRPHAGTCGPRCRQRKSRKALSHFCVGSKKAIYLHKGDKVQGKIGGRLSAGVKCDKPSEMKKRFRAHKKLAR